MKTLFKTLVLFLLAFPAICFAELEWKDFPAIVEFNKGGTGFFIKPDKTDLDKAGSNILVTNFHVVTFYKDDFLNGKVYAYTSSGKKLRIKEIAALDAINDLAVLRVENYKSKHYYLLNHSINSIKHIETAGFPDRKFKYSPGQILSTNLKSENLYTALQKHMGPGSSGSPMFKKDKLIGIRKRENNTISIETPVRLLRELLSKPFISCQTGACIENETKRMRKLARWGDRMAQFNVALDYEYKIKFKKKAVEWYQRAAKQGLPEAQFELGGMYLEGLGTAQNLKKALHWYTSAAKQGLLIAQLALAKMHLEGLGTTQNLKKALHWYTLAAKQGLPIAQFELAKMHLEGLGTTQNLKKALHWYTSAAKQGFLKAQLALARMHLEGLGTTQNPEKALYWYTSAAKQGLPEAQYNLAVMYSHEQGVEQNLKLAGYWAEKALEQGLSKVKDLLIEIKKQQFENNFKRKPNTCRDIFQKKGA